MKVFGQELNALTASIARMNLFLHGVQEYTVVNGDTLSEPAFIKNGHLQQFDVVLANPPYSIKQWNRDAFASDKWGRNFLGVPPQGRADYAFFQHILASMKNDTGRCAILFPHGVLFRDEEKEMREKLVALDLVECVIGIGKNLFYNSPMEACIVICRKQKSSERVGKVLFINARDEVTRKNAQSYLEEKHIKRIVSVYHDFSKIEGFSKTATIHEIQENKSKLSVALYVNHDDKEVETVEAAGCISEWSETSLNVSQALNELNRLLAL